MSRSSRPLGKFTVHDDQVDGKKENEMQEILGNGRIFEQAAVRFLSLQLGNNLYQVFLLFVRPSCQTACYMDL